MIRIDDQLLDDIGLAALVGPARRMFLEQIYDTLELRVGRSLAERMTDEQLDEFEGFIDTDDETGALAWLEREFPDYKQVVADRFEELKDEIRDAAGEIIEAAS